VGAALAAMVGSGLAAWPSVASDPSASPSRSSSASAATAPDTSPLDAPDVGTPGDTDGAGPREPADPGDLPEGVRFQETGTVEGWDNKDPNPQKDGRITTVSKPAFKGDEAISTEQTFISSDGKNYHTESVKRGAHKSGEDLYYGQAIYLPSDWEFHDQPVCFQQWSPEDPGGPWLLMHVDGDMLRYATRKTGYEDIASIANLRGTWIRIVTRIKMDDSDGALDVYVNGKKVVSETGEWAPEEGSTLRWSSGIYPTKWDTDEPAGQSKLTIYHDHARIATSYVLAEPNNWG
jgi:hypothetical protein